MVKKFVLWFLVIFTCFVIFNFSAKEGDNSKKTTETVTKKIVDIVTDNKISNEEIEKEPFKTIHAVIRKIGHFVEFLLLGVFVCLLIQSYGFSLKKSIIITLVFVLFYAATDEIHQLFVGGRDGRVTDVLIDFLGGLTGTALLYLFQKKKLTK